MTTDRFKLQLSIDQIESISNFYSGFLIDEWILRTDVVDWLDNEFPSEWSYDFFYGNHISFLNEQQALLFKLRWL